MPGSLHISAVRLEARADAARVTARVGDADVWFESSDVALRPAMEAFVAPFLLPSVAQGRRLTTATAVAADFAAGFAGVLDIAARWWNYPQLLPQVDTYAVDSAPQRGWRNALCFSGGVDSFHTLLASNRPVDDLVFLHGFDVPLHDTARADACEREMREIARLTGTRAVVVRTNLRAHPAFRAAPWERTHGGALAAVGHVLPSDVGRLFISASYPRARWRPWGSHWELDPFWSGAGLAIEHIGAEVDRVAKLRALRDAPLARKYLRVCWENLSPQLNCSRCEKCIRTQVVLAALGVLDRFATFEPAGTLSSRIDAVARIRDPLIFQRYEDALALGMPPAVAAAVRRLLARSRRAVWYDRIRHARALAAGAGRRLLRVRRSMRMRA